ncbi:hypothetical protein BJ684DRAFT_22052 [Piptocephalis cylindrospora]|uniref:Zinc finger PHD-type domain-containing protein n=1 Tax=Piptocephalis cylindrospora TaxID=1907219 RepID=A0A4V1IXK6_9FUNG|nr:hypothetical protein BJ684DRAFT_22052 [Piptocephalis cylindrospora]|eukprot:RKP11389.1 hypothetical protein BJ684DRAFT_22052 [Piptocephalis cylindrospora]
MGTYRWIAGQGRRSLRSSKASTPSSSKKATKSSGSTSKPSSKRLPSSSPDRGGPSEVLDLDWEGEFVIRCVCGDDDPEGFQLCCEQCLVWQHGECVGFPEETSPGIPDKYFCEQCQPEGHPAIWGRPTEAASKRKSRKRKASGVITPRKSSSSSSSSVSSSPSIKDSPLAKYKEESIFGLSTSASSSLSSVSSAILEVEEGGMMNPLSLPDEQLREDMMGEEEEEEDMLHKEDDTRNQRDLPPPSPRIRERPRRLAGGKKRSLDHSSSSSSSSSSLLPPLPTPPTSSSSPSMGKDEGGADRWESPPLPRPHRRSSSATVSTYVPPAPTSIPFSSSTIITSHDPIKLTHSPKPPTPMTPSVSEEPGKSHGESSSSSKSKASSGSSGRRHSSRHSTTTTSSSSIIVPPPQEGPATYQPLLLKPRRFHRSGVREMEKALGQVLAYVGRLREGFGSSHRSPHPSGPSSSPPQGGNLPSPAPEEGSHGPSSPPTLLGKETEGSRRVQELMHIVDTQATGLKMDLEAFHRWQQDRLANPLSSAKRKGPPTYSSSNEGEDEAMDHD